MAGRKSFSLSMSSFTPPSGYARIKRVGSFDELVNTPLEDGINALYWERDLPGDFSEVAEQLGTCTEGIMPLDEEILRSLELGEAGSIAREILIRDLELLRVHGLLPSLDCIQGYPRDEASGPVVTDVHSFHADSAPVQADTYLCTYLGASSEGLRNEDAIRRVDIPETRAELLRLHGGADDNEFLEYLNENCYDLHYAARPGSQPFEFGIGNLWRIAIEYPGNPVPPCVHRAPLTLPGDPPRLLLIS